MGHHLPQTLFSSIYIDTLLWPEPKTLEQASFTRTGVSPPENPMLHVVLRAYCLALLKICDCIRGTIVEETFYEVSKFTATPTYSMVYHFLSLTYRIGGRFCVEPL